MRMGDTNIKIIILNAKDFKQKRKLLFPTDMNLKGKLYEGKSVNFLKEIVLKIEFLFPRLKKDLHKRFNYSIYNF